MLDGLRAEGEAAVLVHWTLAEDIRGLKRVKDALAAGKPLPLALREARVWGAKERLFERALPLLARRTRSPHLLEAAQVCDGLVKGLRHPDWPLDPWDALQRLVLMLAQQTAAPRGSAGLRLALHGYADWRRSTAARAAATRLSPVRERRSGSLSRWRERAGVRGSLSSRAADPRDAPAPALHAAHAHWPPPPPPRCAGRSAPRHAAAR